MIPWGFCQKLIQPTDFNTANCALPYLDVTTIPEFSLQWKESTNIAPGLGVSLQAESKSLLIESLRFHYAYAISLPAGPEGASGLLEIRSAIAVLEVASDGTPVELPDLTQTRKAFTHDILWRGLDYLFASSTITGASLAGTAGGIQQAGRVMEHVKSKRRLGDNQQVFWCSTITNPFNEAIDFELSVYGVAAVRVRTR